MTAAVALLLPGMSLNATIFPPFDMPTVTADFTRLVLGPDGEDPSLRSRRMGRYVDLLDQRLSASPAWRTPRRIVVAHSFGGMLALAWWLAHGGAGPARVDGLVLIATTAGPVPDAARLLLFGTRRFEVRLPLAGLLKIWNLPPVTRAAKRLLGGGTLAGEVDFRRLAHPTDWSVDRAGWRNTDWRAMRSYRLAMDGFDVRDRIGALDVPAIVLHGTRDTLFPARAARDLAARLPRADLWMIEGAGHALPLTHGGHVARAVAALR